jgi:hypothetical protein
MRGGVDASTAYPASLGRDVCLAEIARQAGVSRFHLSRAFGAATGVSLMRYLRGRRLSEAARLLAGGAGDILVVLGGTIPNEDAEELKAQGVAAGDRHAHGSRRPCAPRCLAPERCARRYRRARKCVAALGGKGVGIQIPSVGAAGLPVGHALLAAERQLDSHPNGVMTRAPVRCP